MKLSPKPGARSNQRGGISLLIAVPLSVMRYTVNEFGWKISVKDKKPKCQVWMCRCNRHQRNKLCGKHMLQLDRLRNPISQILRGLRQSAKIRGHSCSLTLPQMKEFCDKHKYVELLKTEKGLWTIDRIRNEEGYHADNIQPMKRDENTKKAWQDYEIHPGRKTQFQKKLEQESKELKIKSENNEEVPF